MKTKTLFLLTFSAFLTKNTFGQGGFATNNSLPQNQFLGFDGTGVGGIKDLNIRNNYNRPINFFTNNVQRATLFGNNPPAPPVWYSPLPFGGGMGINLNTTNPILHPMALLHIGEYPSTL